MAARADRHELYQEAVQCVESEIDFVDQTYLDLRGRRARWLREDFCGTGNTACEWVRRRRLNHAIGVDLDTEVMAWGKEHNISSLGGSHRRIQLLEGDVLKLRTQSVDILLAMNFSYWLFATRRLMKRYFRRVRDNLRPDGLFFLDAYGGYDSYKVTRDRHACKGFTYIWDQAAYDPVTSMMQCYIHFSFPDGSRLREAFSYRWRVWTLPEIRELLAEAGFKTSTVYWQGTDEESGEPDGHFVPVDEGEPDPAWIAYIVAEK